ncbi:hypothetical protein BC830DRAFT_1157537 [Chytriomyces sp. MP71]|nr:hypothetical protein BC830DRAFT_1157537 [Chytriomyces sp. MP71]
MEFYDVGKHCARPDCNQQDYLPFTCTHCRKNYCATHKFFDSHVDCTPPSAAAPLACLACRQPVNGTSPHLTSVHNERVLAAHVKGGCKSAEEEARERRKAKECAFGRCRRTEGVVFGCRECGLRYCSTHRIGTDHACKPVVGGGMKTGGSGVRATVVNVKGVSKLVSA